MEDSEAYEPKRKKKKMKSTSKKHEEISEDDLRAADAHVNGAAAAAAAVPEDEIPPPVPVAMAELNWADYVQDPNDPVTDPDFCLWCCFALCARQAKTGNKKWERLKKYHEENWGHVHPFKFARESQRIYNEKIRDNLTDGKGRKMRGPAWPAQQIHEHPINHVFIARCAHTENAFIYQTALRRIRDKGLFMSDGSVCLKTLKAFQETEKQARILYEKVDASKSTALYGF